MDGLNIFGEIRRAQMNRPDIEGIEERLKNSVQIVNMKDSPFPLFMYNGDACSDMTALLEYIRELEKDIEAWKDHFCSAKLRCNLGLMLIGKYK
jgi:hypothetical protein